ncbi:MAG: glucose 1-dehydrogenase [Porticoccaceae bacterium]|nr:glucose 1-dehydrogenase [Porticoccaceae bacterium]
MGRVSGKVAIVTGAARGMGAAFAKRLVEEGARVVLTDVLDGEGKATAQSLGGNAVFVHQDVTSEEHWIKTVNKAESVFGPVSVLVNNAGVVKMNPIETLSERDYRRTIDVNQVAVFLGMKSVLPSMKRAGGGSIINISSIAGINGAPDSISYCASKFAVTGMTKAAAIEFAACGIRVNSIHPGLIRTPMTVPSADKEELLSTLLQGTPAGRIGEPEEVASVVVMLASDEARFCTGAQFVVDGGVTCQ